MKRIGYGFFFINACCTVRLVTVRHQDSVVYGRTQLNGSDDDARDERKRRTCVVRNSHIYKDSEFYDCHQDDRYRDRPERDQDDEEHDDYRYRVYTVEIRIRDVHQVLSTRSLTYKHRRFIVLLYDLLDLGTLLIYSARGCSILRCNYHQLLVAVI